MGKHNRIVGLTLLAGLYSSNVFAEADLEFGEYLSSECTSCHLLSGKESNIPTIIALDTEIFISALKEYQNKERENKVMQVIASRLEPDEMESLAAYFATIEPEDEDEDNDDDE